MRLSCKGWLVFSQPLRLLVGLSGFVVAAIGTAPGGRLSRWELHTLIANILVIILIEPQFLYSRKLDGDTVTTVDVASFSLPSAAQRRKARDRSLPDAIDRQDVYRIDPCATRV